MDNALFWVIYVVVIVGVMYFIAIRPQRKQQKELIQAMREKKGSESQKPEE